MAGEEEPEEKLDFDEFMETIEENRKQRREQASYSWCVTVREAGELYREADDVEAVADELERSEAEVREALTVYRLIFEEPPEEVAWKSSRLGRAFFSLDQDYEEAIDEDEEEPPEDMIREYVGATYLEHGIDEEPVGEPPEATTPPLAVDFEEIKDVISDFTFPSQTVLKASKLANLQSDLVSSAMAPVVAQQSKLVDAAVKASLSPAVQQIQKQQSLVNAAVAGVFPNVIEDLQIPQSVLTDLSTINPAIQAAATATATTPSNSERSVVAEASTTTVEAEPLEATVTTTSALNAAEATVDATLPGTDTVSTELVFEIPALLVESILSTGRARSWFTELSEDHQITVVRYLLVAIAFSLTGNFGIAAIAALGAPTVRQIILND